MITATRRPRMLPSPRRANSDSAFDCVTSGLTFFCSTFGIGSGMSVMPSPSATAFARPMSTCINPDTMRSRIAGTWTLVSSKRNALMMCCCSTGVWLV